MQKIPFLRIWVKVAARLWFNATVAAGDGVMWLDGNIYGHDGSTTCLASISRPH
ncbi:hypothetical protein [Nitrosospira sp. Nsp13]|uniref:hypothetical protein n=1 Tax=Nitrosospira sp. Nsp13 TaxID=1855332 RepID=UPI0015868BDB|nr:hypothetical protein [Nitrosospira sp. Nsp13]